MRLGESSQCPSTQLPTDGEDDFGGDYVDIQAPAPFREPTISPVLNDPPQPASARSSSCPSQSQGATPHKVRGPNWIEAEMLVLIGQKRKEWDGRHNCSQPSLARFVYGTTAWKLVLAGCLSEVGFRVRDTDQITNKWDGLIKDYKKLKEYIDSSGSANWWGLSRDSKKQLSRTRKMSLEFSEAMYIEMEAFVGKRQIFGRATDVVDSDRVPPSATRQFVRSTPVARAQQAGGLGSPIASATTNSDSPTRLTPGDDTPGSTGRKRKAVGTDNLVDFVKDFNFDYLARVEAQDKDRQAWRSDMLAFDKAREARIAQKETEVITMDQKMYELEVERTKNLGNMTGALLMLASSMDVLTRSYVQPSFTTYWFRFTFLPSQYALQCGWHFVRELGSPRGPPWPSGLLAMLGPRQQAPSV